MNIDEAKKYIGNMTPDETAQIVVEHNRLKQHLCAAILSIPTGTDDWIERSLERARDLRECDHQLRKVVHGCGVLLNDAKWRTKQETCFNCRGTGKVGKNSCCICNGTGASHF